MYRWIVRFSGRAQWLLLAFLAMPWAAGAQQTRFAAFKDDNKRNPFIYVLGADISGFYTFRYGQSDRILEKHTFDLNLIYTMNVATDPRSARIEDVGLLEDKPTVFFSDYDELTRRNSLAAFSVVRAGKLSESFAVMSDTLTGLKGKGSYRFLQSRSRQYSAVLHQQEIKPNVWGFEVAFQDAKGFGAVQHGYRAIAGEVATVRQVELDDRGQAWVLLRVEGNEPIPQRPRDKDAANQAGLNTFYKIVRFDPVNGAMEFMLTSPGVYLGDARLGLDNANGRMQVVSFYSDKRQGGIGGVLLSYISDSSGVVLGQVQRPLPEDLVAKVMGVRDADRQQEPSDFRFRTVAPTVDGGLTFLAEMEYTAVRSIPQNYNGFMGYRDVTYYHYRDVMLGSLDSTAKFQWWSLVNKDQTSSNPGEYSSFLSMVQTDKLSLIFNETPYVRSSLLQALVDAEGKTEVSILSGAAASDLMVLPEGGRQISAKSVLVPAIKDKKYGILKVSYP